MTMLGYTKQRTTLYCSKLAKTFVPHIPPSGPKALRHVHPSKAILVPPQFSPYRVVCHIWSTPHDFCVNNLKLSSSKQNADPLYNKLYSLLCVLPVIYGKDSKTSHFFLFPGPPFCFFLEWPMLTFSFFGT